MQAKLLAYLRDSGRKKRRERMEAMYRGYMDGVYAVEDERLLVRLLEMGSAIVLTSHARRLKLEPCYQTSTR